MTNAPANREAHGSDYEALRRRLVPHFETFRRAAVGALAPAADPPRILELGARTGVLTRRLP